MDISKKWLQYDYGVGSMLKEYDCGYCSKVIAAAAIKSIIAEFDELYGRGEYMKRRMQCDNLRSLDEFIS